MAPAVDNRLPAARLSAVAAVSRLSTADKAPRTPTPRCGTRPSIASPTCRKPSCPSSCHGIGTPTDSRPWPHSRRSPLKAYRASQRQQDHAAWGTAFSGRFRFADTTEDGIALHRPGSSAHSLSQGRLMTPRPGHRRSGRGSTRTGRPPGEGDRTVSPPSEESGPLRSER